MLAHQGGSDNVKGGGLSTGKGISAGSRLWSRGEGGELASGILEAGIEPEGFAEGAGRLFLSTETEQCEAETILEAGAGSRSEGLLVVWNRARRVAGIGERIGEGGACPRGAGLGP